MIRTMTPMAHLGRAIGTLAGLWALSIPATLAALASACRTLDADDVKMAVSDDSRAAAAAQVKRWRKLRAKRLISSREEIIKAMAEASDGHLCDSGVTRTEWTTRCRGCDWSVEGIALEAHDAHRAELELNAVEHLIRADALTDAAYQIDRDNPANVVRWLCDRADQLEKGTKE